MKKLIVAIFLLFIAGSFSCVRAEISTEAKFYYNQGVDYYKNGAYDKSMESFRQAINLDPNYIDAYYNLGSLLEYLKQDEEALSIFKKIIVRNPSDYDSVYKAAEISNRLGYTKEAKTYLSIIPPESLVYPKASALAYSIGADMLTIKEEKKTETLKDSTPQTNGIYTKIESPTGITHDNEGNLYVASFSENVIYRITSDGKRIINVKDARISGPIGIAVDDNNNLYIANYNKDNVLKVSNSGQVSVVLGNVSKPYIIYIKGNMLYVSSQGSNSVIRYKLN